VKPGSSLNIKSIATSLLLISAHLFSVPADSCTTVHVESRGHQWTAKGYDWHQGHGAVFVNKRGVEKKSLALARGDQEVPWVSRFGSVTFNQIAREFPNGGINEAGLVVEIMWLASSIYPEPNSLGSLNELQWIQFQLDTSETIADVLQNASQVRVSSLFAKVHYMACDRSGACATFEYVDGNLITHSGSTLPVSTLTNDTYADSIAELTSYDGFGGNRSIPSGGESISRFLRASSLAQQARNVESRDVTTTGFSILDSVAQGSYTKWQIVYDQTNMSVAFRTREAVATKTISLRPLDFDCDAPVLTMDLSNQAVQGAIENGLNTYSSDLNQRLVRRSLWPIALALPRGTIQAIQAFPETTTCATSIIVP
jgi:penicillin V acylase-like amidase (Ntn superfamily)